MSALIIAFALAGASAVAFAASARRWSRAFRALAFQRLDDLAEAAMTYAAMRTEIEALRCGDLVPFQDGELSPERHAAFRDHLTRCPTCERELERHMQLTVQMAAAKAEGAPREPPAVAATEDERTC